MKKRQPRNKKGRRKIALYRKDPLFKTFLSDIRKLPLLSPNKQVSLILQAQKGDAEARKQLGECNARLLVRIALDYANHKLHINDLIQEGYIGLNEAIDKFNPDKNVPFPHYASWWIKMRILRYIQWCQDAIRLPESQKSSINKLFEISTIFTSEHMRKPTIEELVDLSGMTKDTVRNFALHCDYDRFHDTVVTDDDEELTLALPSSEVTPEEMTDRNIITEAISKCLDTLSERHQEFLRDYYGIGRPAVRVCDMAKRTNTSTENIRQMRARLIKYLQNNCSEDLAPYYE